MRKPKKILLLAIIFIIAVSTLSGCNLPGMSNNTSINVFNWGEYIDQNTLKDFYKETGIKVNYETYATNEDMYQKVKNGTTTYDLICPSDYMIQRMIKEKLIQKIDYSKLSNYKNIDDKYRKQSFDPNDEYTVPYFWGTLGILYDKKKITDQIDSWNVLWDKKYKNDIFMSDDMRNSIGIALKKLGYSFNSTNKDEIQKATDLLISQRSEINTVYVGDQIKDNMRNGEKSIAVMYSGDATVLTDEKPDQFAYVIPKEGTNVWYDSWAIPANAKNKEAAEKLINYLLDAKVNKKNVDAVGYATPNKATLELLDDKVKNDKTSYPDKDVLDKGEVFTDLGDARDLYSNAWLKVTSK